MLYFIRTFIQLIVYFIPLYCSPLVAIIVYAKKALFYVRAALRRPRVCIARSAARQANGAVGTLPRIMSGSRPSFVERDSERSKSLSWLIFREIAFRLAERSKCDGKP